jgi:hypothetical protein
MIGFKLAWQIQEDFPLGILLPYCLALPPARNRYYFLPPPHFSGKGENHQFDSGKDDVLIADRRDQFSFYQGEKKRAVGSVSKKWLTKIVKFFKVKSTK